MSAHDHDDAPLTAEDLCLDGIGHGCFAINLEGQVEAFVPSIRDRLIERGALYQTTDSRWHLRWTSLDLERERAADMAVCDFCSSRPVTWVIPCEDFAMPDPPGCRAPGVSVGDWAACEACGRAVAAGDRAALLARCVAGHAELPRQVRRLMSTTRQKLQRRFWAHYRGGALRVTPHPYGH